MDRKMNKKGNTANTENATVEKNEGLKINV